MSLRRDGIENGTDRLVARRARTSESPSARSSRRRTPSAPQRGERVVAPPAGMPQSSATKRQRGGVPMSCPMASHVESSGALAVTMTRPAGGSAAATALWPLLPAPPAVRPAMTSVIEWRAQKPISPARSAGATRDEPGVCSRGRTSRGRPSHCGVLRTNVAQKSCAEPTIGSGSTHRTPRGSDAEMAAMI